MVNWVVRLKAEDLDAIRKHGESAYPHECCGLLLGRLQNEEKVFEEIYPVANTWEEESQRNRFLISPVQLIQGEKHAREENLEVLGFYHSHPEAQADPSKFDLENAWPFYSYIIVSVRERRARELNSWRMVEDRSRFEPETIIPIEPEESNRS